MYTDLLGRNYSKQKFDGYTHRARVRIEVTEVKNHKVTKRGFNVEIYTDNANREGVQETLWQRSAENVTKLEIDWWATREQDEAAAELIEEFLN